MIYQQKVREAEVLKVNLDKEEKTLFAANNLIGKLTNERVRWGKLSKDFEVTINELPRRMLAAAAFMTFLGKTSEAKRIPESATFNALVDKHSPQSKSLSKSKSGSKSRYLSPEKDRRSPKISPNLNSLKRQNSSNKIESDLQNHKIGLKENEVKLVTDYNTLFELNKKLFQQLKGDEYVDLTNDPEDNNYNITGKRNNEMGLDTFYTAPSEPSKTRTFNDKTSTGVQAFENDDKWEVKTSGQCKMVYKDGSEYQGDIRNGKYHGHGVFTYPSGHVYIGEWSNGFQNSQIKLMYKDGTKYTGLFKNGMRHGQGYMQWNDGKQTYEGEFLKDKKHGNGREKFINNDVYEGMYKLGKKDGKGLYKWSSGTQYTGDYKNNMMDGNGVMTWPISNRRYEGQMKHNFRSGIGTFLYSDGTFYQGGFLRDKRYGFGVIRLNDGGSYRGSGRTTSNRVRVHADSERGCARELLLKGKEMDKETYDALNESQGIEINKDQSMIIDKIKQIVRKDGKEIIDRSHVKSRLSSQNN